MSSVTNSDVFSSLEEVEGIQQAWPAAESVFAELDTAGETAGSEPAWESDTEADWETDTETDSEADWETDTETDSETDTETDSEADWETDTEADTETDWEADTETDTEADYEADWETDSEADWETGTETGSETDWETDTEADWESDEVPNDLEVDAILPGTAELDSPHHLPRGLGDRHQRHRVSAAGVAARVAHIAEQQYRRWHPSGRALVDTSPEATQILQDYYQVGVGKTVTANQLQSAAWQQKHSWNSVFASWALKHAGAGSAFLYSVSSQLFIRSARTSRLSGDGSHPFWAYRTTEIAPQVGDLVCASSHGSGATYDNIADPQARRAHCYIVTAVRPGEIRVIGGGIHQAVGAKILQTNSDGRLRVDGKQAHYFAVIRCNDAIAAREAWPDEAASWIEPEFDTLDEERPETPSGVITFTAHTLPMRVSAYATRAARTASGVDVLVFAHGLDRCSSQGTRRPDTFLTDPPFRLRELAEASGRPLVVVVPFLDWENIAANKMVFGQKWHKIAQPANFNGVVAEALQSVGSPAIQRLIVAGHSRAYGVLDALANAHADPDMTRGPLSHLSQVWALDSAYTSPVADWMAWLGSRNALQITVIYRYGDALATGAHGNRFRAQVPAAGDRLRVIPVRGAKVAHCQIPGAYLPRLLKSLPAAVGSSKEAPSLDEWEADLELDGFGGDTEVEEFHDDELLGEQLDEELDPEADETLEPEMEAFGAFEELEDESHDTETLGADGGLTPAELKAVQITSTFETGKRGGFYGLSGNFDGYGISFGLVNWNIGSDSLQPLLRDFASTEPARWKAVFGPDASVFAALISRTGKDAVKDQLRFAIQEMNTSEVVKGKARWSVKEPWVTYFKRLAADPAFQRIQVRHVRDLLDRARYYCAHFGLKSEMSFAFMFDTVASHGKWWLTKQCKDGTAKRQQLLSSRLAALRSKNGEGRVPETDVLLAIADVLAATSNSRWRDNVLRRKRWFVTGEHPRARELRGLKPRPDVGYQNAAPVRETTVAEEVRPSADRAALISAAYKQATTAGTAADRSAIAQTLKLNGTDAKAWFAGMVPDATFLGRHIRASGGVAPGVHLAMLDALRRAEHRLLGTHSGRSAAQLGKDLGIRDIGGLRPPKKATGGTMPSMHCFGLAVDINYSTNPFVGNYKSGIRSPDVINRAMWLLHGVRFNVMAPLTATNAGAAWDIHHRASQALAEYLRLADDPDGARLRQLVALAQSRGEPNGPEWWKGRVIADRSAMKTGDFQHHPHPELTGYLDLPRELIVDLADAGLLWGGLYRGAKDIMHFDLRSGPIKRS
jgi:hypothetical protein